MHEQRIIDQVDRMVASGLITSEEATQLRGAPGTDGFEEVIVAIRARHAQAARTRRSPTAE